MYIIVIGVGRLGYYLIKALLDEGHEVLAIEKNAAVCEIVVGELGSVCIHGDGCETSTLAELGTNRADMLIAVTVDEEDNLVALQLAKHTSHIQRTATLTRKP